MSESGESDDWLGEFELLERYKGREHQARAIMQNAGARVHPHRQVTLYQDAKIKTQRGSRYSRKASHATNISTEQKMKKPKVTKPPAAPKEKVISAATKTRLEKNIVKAETHGNDLDAMIKKASADKCKDSIGR
eukprot:2158377-Pyramimonas_sp.AAC.1